ncbi:hypothetical protein [Streptomyces sp. NBC_01320]|uniref:hypothetical protein n=1 Tax=Streptomyces sp. NBC_01320 TaxID=2903824 RepID=UPI002E0E694F|nr:hypothetical protein OG395_01390 [Streptomyces sp. NBC_01320]WSK01004.1 hypothetical protein OG395_53965 [Streptomyces sp. NBC_01320]
MGPGRLPRRARAAQEGLGRDARGHRRQPFVDALSELVQAQADTTGIVVLHRWAEILEWHFPPELPDPDRTTE